jgi:hypothetical protein
MCPRPAEEEKMRTAKAGWTSRERALLALCVASLGISIVGYLDLGGSAGAAPRGGDERITSSDIAKGTIRSSDLGNGRIRARDLDLYTVYDFSVLVRGKPFFNEATAVAHCRAGDRVISGGYTHSTEELEVSSSQPTDDNNGWAVRGLNAGQIDGYLYPLAVCMND